MDDVATIINKAVNQRREAMDRAEKKQKAEFTRGLLIETADGSYESLVDVVRSLQKAMNQEGTHD